ncbi:Oviduct-specific glycoprotein, partial [Linnemannia exigua]
MKQTAGGCPDYPPFEPSDLPVDLYTHLNFAFALIDGNGLIASQEAKEIPKYQQVNDLKSKKPSLRTAVTVGGWDMDMAHYSTMVSTRENRQKFIQSAITFVRKYGFDGLDFDWEYPGDQKRGGHPEDAENFVLFLKEMREAANAENLGNGQERLILSIALPGGPFHGDNFLIPKLAPHVDWFNIMAYNLHGQWESQVYCAAPLNDPASQTKYEGYSLIQAIQSMAPQSVSPQKFNIGLSLSGVTFTLKDKTKTLPGSPANGPGRKGCQEKGAMSFFEANRLMEHETDAFHRRVTQAPRLDEKSQCVYMVVDQDQWVGIDTPETFSYKVDYFRKYNFGG